MFADLFSYLNGHSYVVGQVAARNRPMVGATDLNSTLLIPHNERLFEVGFPYITPSEFQQHGHKLLHQLSDGLLVSGEVMDEAAIEDQTELEQYQAGEWGNLIDTNTSHSLQRFNWLFDAVYKMSQRGTLYLPTLLPIMQSLQLKDAELPLVVSLEKKYQLTHKLRSRTGKLNCNLRRTNELISISQIQELDSYCIRDYIRRPGHTPEEKAGSRQVLMGVKRYQDYNNLENKFLVYFAAKILYLECFRYEKDGNTQHLDTVTKLKQVIENFKQDPVVKEIKISGFKMTRPNYVLQQNSDYRGFYQAYQDYIRQRTEKIKVWTYRNKLGGEIVYIYLVAALLRLQGVSTSPGAKFELRNNPDMGGYLTTSGVNLQVLLQDTLYDFHLGKSERLEEGDYTLRVEKHDLNSFDLNIVQITLPIWIFWYCPSQSSLDQAKIYLEKSKEGVVIYLERPLQETVTIGHSWLHQFPSLDDDFCDITQFLAQEIIIPFLRRTR